MCLGPLPFVISAFQTVPLAISMTQVLVVAMVAHDMSMTRRCQPSRPFVSVLVELTSVRKTRWIPFVHLTAVILAKLSRAVAKDLLTISSIFMSSKPLFVTHNSVLASFAQNLIYSCSCQQSKCSKVYDSTNSMPLTRFALYCSAGSLRADDGKVQK
jgi:hypothetical protein